VLNNVLKCSNSFYHLIIKSGEYINFQTDHNLWEFNLWRLICHCRHMYGVGKPEWNLPSNLQCMNKNRTYLLQMNYLWLLSKDSVARSSSTTFISSVTSRILLIKGLSWKIILSSWLTVFSCHVGYSATYFYTLHLCLCELLCLYNVTGLELSYEALIVKHRIFNTYAKTCNRRYRCLCT